MFGSRARCLLVTIAFLTRAHTLKLLGAGKNVLLFGCSVDRNAVEFFCKFRGHSASDVSSLGSRGQGANLSKVLDARWCHDKQLDLNIASMFHPGVGFYGDLRPPFFEKWAPTDIQGKACTASTKDIVELLAAPAAKSLLGASPDVVVVDSSLWDLVNWKMLGETVQDITDERYKQWCDHDLPNLMENVSAAFPTSTVAFRTAPGFSGGEQKWRWFSLNAVNVHELHECILRSMNEHGKLFGKYPVIDYRGIVDRLKKRGPGVVDQKSRRPLDNVFLKDGMHPDAYPSVLFINRILEFMGVEPPPVQEPQLQSLVLSNRHHA